MTKTFPRFTLAAEAVLEGKGLHSGLPCRVRIVPAGSGLRFATPTGTVDARPENVTGTQRCTQLAGISTVEHVLSALAGLGVTDADLVVEGGELPAADGCSAPFVNAILGAGLAPCGSLDVEGPFERVYVVNGSSKVAIAKGEGWWRAEFEVIDSFIGRQVAEVALCPASYAAEIAPARTTVFEDEWESAQAAGLGLGLDEKTVVGIGKEGYANEPRFADEPARHKLLDLIGDLALSGVPVVHLDVIGERSSHATNIEAAAQLARSVALTYRD